VPEVVLALDLPSREDALDLVDGIPEVRWVKVGPVLLTPAGPGIVGELVDRGLRVFLDLKWHDIPNTVAGAVAAAQDMGVAMATVHTLGGPRMMESAARAAGSLALVGVTVLTSHTPEEWGSIMGRARVEVAAEVGRLAALGRAAGLDGVVCSVQEAALVRPVLAAEALVVTPGIRLPGDAGGDQARVAGPAEAAAAGATHLVVGRPVLAAPDPRVALGRFMEDAG